MYKDALELDEGFQRAKDGLSRAQKLQKQSEQRDYYKILGVKRWVMFLDSLVLMHFD